MLSEFDLIHRYFTRAPATDARIGLGIGDDCALLRPVPGTQLAVSTDMLVEGRHFLAGSDARCLGHKALAVNLSDLAAMGATPIAFTLALSLPTADAPWLEAFSGGLLALADQYRCNLIGGDTTRGPLNICITVFGELPAGVTLRRNGARSGDDVWVSGTLGDARVALAMLCNESPEASLTADETATAIDRLQRPEPRIALGIELRTIATAAIDLSDGFTGDLGHILACSGCGATIDVDALPAGPALRRHARATRQAWALAGGDDYELCFTASAGARAAVIAAGQASATAVTRVGTIDIETGLRLRTADGAAIIAVPASFDHFSV